MDIAGDSLVYNSSHITMVFEADPDSPFTFPAVAVFTRVADSPESRKVKVITTSADHLPLMQKLQAMASDSCHEHVFWRNTFRRNYELSYQSFDPLHSSLIIPRTV